jgi:hypothetical protein
MMKCYSTLIVISVEISYIIKSIISESLKFIWKYIMFKKISTALWVAIIFVVTVIGLIVYISIQDSDVLDKSNVRKGIINVRSIDTNLDGFVYQDSMHLNVISDIPGLCPFCFMPIKKVTDNEAISNLKDQNFEVK